MQNIFKKRFFFIIAVALLAVFLVNKTDIIAREHQINILVLNSYHKGFVWTDSIVESIDGFLSEKGVSHRSFIEYMDTKRIVSPVHIQNLYILYKEKYKNIPIDAIISTDDNALTFLTHYHQELFPHVPIIACGVNDINSISSKQEKLFTIIPEMIDIRSTIDIARKLHTNRKKLFVIVDRTPTGNNTYRILQDAVSSFLDLDFIYLRDFSMEEVVQKVKLLSDNAIVLLLNFNRDSIGQVFTHMETISILSSVCPVPIYGVWDFFLGKGIIGGMLSKGSLQGRHASQLVLDFLSGVSPRDLNIDVGGQNQLLFDFRYLDKFGVSLSSLPKEALVINSPQSFYSINKHIIWSLVSSIAFLGLITLFLTINIFKRKAAEMSSVKLNRALITLNHCNQAVIRSHNEKELLLEICRVIVEIGGYRLCWVGYIDSDDNTFSPQAIWSYEKGHEPSETLAWCNNTLDCGINEISYQSGEPFVVQDVRNEKVYAPWIDEAVSRGLLSTISLPLRTNNSTFGILRIYSPEINGFDLEEIGLLNWLSDNLTYGIISQRILVEHRDAVDQLQRSSEQLSMLLESLPIVPYSGVGNKRTSSHLTYIGSTFKDITGYTVSEFKKSGNFFEKLIHPEDQDKFIEWQKNIETSEIRKINYRFKNADGTYCWICDIRRNVPRIGLRDTYFVGTWQDITKEVKLEIESNERLHQLIQADKLASLGEVVAGVAHEINNPNSFISYNIPIWTETWAIFRPIIDSWAEDNPQWEKNGITLDEYCDDLDEIIRDIAAGSTRINKVVKNLKEFSRSSEDVEVLQLSLNEAVNKAITIIGPEIRRSVKIFNTDLQDELPLITGQLVKIEQITTNLAVNAINALSGCKNAQLTIRTRHIDRLHCNLLQIEDNGVGIEPEIIDRIFEPFFTKRRDSKGTGLGLSVCYRLVQEHKGNITVCTRFGVGTIFDVFFPVTGEKINPVKPTVIYFGTLSDINRRKLLSLELAYQFVQLDTALDEIFSRLVEYPETIAVVVEAHYMMDENNFLVVESIRKEFPVVSLLLVGSDKFSDIEQKVMGLFDDTLNDNFFEKINSVPFSSVTFRSL